MPYSPLATMSVAFGALLAFASSSQADTALAASLGITPESAIVAGLTSAEASGVLSYLDTATSLRVSFQQKSAAVNAAAQTVSQLANALGSAPSEQLQNQYQQAVTDLSAATALLDQAKNMLIEAITVDLSSQQIARIELWRATEGRHVPASFRVSERTDEQWAAIEVALRAESRATRTGQTLASEFAQLLNGVRAETDVAEAEAHLTSSLASMESVFQSN